jgi:Zn-dependent membrane protease YugP
VLFFNSGWLLLMIVSTVIGVVTQGYVNSTYRKWSRVPLASGQSGSQIARRILDSDGLGSVGIGQIPGNLTDNYDPRVKKLSLSQGVYQGTSVAAAGVAAHEAGHALQDHHGYSFGRIRSALVPVASFGSNASWIFIIVGFFLGATTSFGNGLIWLGVIFYAAAVLFQIVTLPVEFDASRRALGQLETVGGLPPQQVAGARSVLSAAALTYVAAALIAALQLLYLIGLARRD